MNVFGASNMTTATAGATERKGKSDLGKDQFMQLLVAQMRFQDPLKPMENKEFIAQLAQFSALEQMMNVGKAANMTFGMSVLGKKVYGVDASGTPVEGKALSVRLVSGNPMVKVQPATGNPVDVDLAHVTQVDTIQ